MKERIYKFLPDLLQCLVISMFNFLAYKERYGGSYKVFLNKFESNRNLSLDRLKDIQRQRFDSFLKYAKNNSEFYKYYNLVSINNISELPIVKKEDLRRRINDVYTLSKEEGIVSKTGGTTGKSLEVIFTKSNMQERFALLDDFRNRYGYELGKKTAWFSGKDLLGKKDIKRKRFWKTDFLYHVRYYSTFHIKEENLKYYVENLIEYKPEFLVGFPSTILEIAKYGLQKGYKYPKGFIKAIFPTAETITEEMRYVIEEFFNCKMFNQYASSEGAPFIFECSKGKLHLELQSGVFEVLDDNDNSVESGRLIVTSFTSEGTPLIRYDIGDMITLGKKPYSCNCGNNNPLVKEILGRIDDYVYSPENGKINLGNVSNTLKDTQGIVRFQVVQDEIDTIEIYLDVDNSIFNKDVEKKFLSNWRDRVGFNMEIKLKYTDVFEVEKSGKFRLVKNNIKHLI